MAKRQNTGIKQVAGELGVSTKWIRRRIAAGLISPGRTGTKRNSRFVLSESDIEALRLHRDAPPAAGDVKESSSLARIGQLEADRANLLAQVAWARAIAQEQAKALESERERTATLAAEVESQRDRVEQLKALSAWDRVRGRHKDI
ncbi:MAG: hypothetical protein Q8M66_06380 [Actinomycetota bacterium]|nr:hypothetical protein [Actinomycetota bacterium]MDZ4179861.1 hypothetical protein [Coriobacteriia bacterium]